MSRLYTPEYSDELLEFVQDVYSQDVKHYYAKLKLEKLIELLEQAESLFETYRESLSNEKYEDCLSAYVIGAFYVFLIIPGSVQYSARNKSYGIYTDLKKLYQEELTMSNVLLMVLHKVDSVLNHYTELLENLQLDPSRKRAFSVEEPVIRNQLQNFHLENTDNKSADEDFKSFASTEWKAPQLDPDDRLQLAMASSKTTESSSSNSLSLDEAPEKADDNLAVLEPILDEIQNSTKNNHQHVNNKLKRSVPRHQSLPTENPYNLYSKNDSSLALEMTNNFDRSRTHRKDSYHSVYLADEPEDINNNSTGLARLQQENIIDCSSLFTLLQNPESREKLLLIDLRFPKRFESNHIVGHYLINIDPSILFDTKKGLPVDSLQDLKKIQNNPILDKINQYDYIVYYTDYKSFMHVTFNYELILFKLLFKTARSAPKSLLGGYEQWKAFLSRQARNCEFDKSQFLFRKSKHSSQSGCSITTTTNDAATEIEASLETPFPPIEEHIQEPNLPPVPKAAPPPLPNTTDKAFGAVYNRPPIPLPKNNPPPVLKPSTATEFRTQQRNDWAMPTEHIHTPFSIPTIERSPNEFVSLSITGLRNMGNTCYINAMLQCLFGCSQFRSLFLSGKYHRYFNPKQNGTSISKWFSLLFRKMYLNGGCSVVPSGFLKSCHMLRPDFNIPTDQQDTQEFLLFLLDTLHDELSEPTKVANDYPDLLLHDDEKLTVNSKEYDRWFDESLKNNGLSPIDDIFQGQMENSLTCQRCKFTSYNYSTFYVLSLAIPALPAPKTFSRTKRIIRLEDCINLFTQDELLTGENAWDCPNCGSHSDSTEGSRSDENVDKKKKRNFLSANGDSKSRSKFFKLSSSKNNKRSLSPFRSSSNKPEKSNFKSKKMTTIKSLNFITMPNILVIHLSRFFYDLTKKNETMINYPLILDVVLKNNEIARYRLYGIVNHFGNLVSGHYTSLVNKDLSHEIRNGQQKWYYFDDEVVKKEINHGDFDRGITSISSGDVYVLFYEKVKNI
ncbi:unnamed protein product [Kluyveromyces dobzhanskii CBS 2104]|uniref:ubiquitinyl hydrolase 1 n=1 Tax=Kluyveromyces dobzhanskii CBS 2104 TaxID=1427455 RepID=A0A0A8KYW9_9SACH|nr:unnamed protein product [Kluyveromyces dobzhanskii CBS 2104]